MNPVELLIFAAAHQRLRRVSGSGLTDREHAAAIEIVMYGNLALAEWTRN